MLKIKSISLILFNSMAKVKAFFATDQKTQTGQKLDAPELN